MEIARIFRRRRVEQIAHRELEAGLALEGRDLFLPLISAAQAEESLEELSSGVDI
jgi:hypothetical protein